MLSRGFIRNSLSAYEVGEFELLRLLLVVGLFYRVEGCGTEADAAFVEWPPRPSSSGKRWRICGLGRRFKPHTMQSRARGKKDPCQKYYTTEEELVV
ncbi:hypothetical protein H5410_020538 [Solanum commersonii]|uniref:Uncharacterized protein n=1 Tax=Solanum commersonii TaxID=4109 RepID=A0A9J5Z8Q5_SOLCO|nr:hypothetical protein H5410_020538 [Solanum commersonii]